MRSLPQDMSVAVPFLRSCLTFYLEEIRFSPVADAAFVIQEPFWTIRPRSSSHAQTVLGWHYKTAQFAHILLTSATDSVTARGCNRASGQFRRRILANDFLTLGQGRGGGACGAQTLQKSTKKDCKFKCCWLLRGFLHSTLAKSGAC